MAQTKRVLILEENVDHLELLTGLLENHFSPIDIHTVESIEDCLDFLEQNNYDLVLSGCFVHDVCITERLSHIIDVANGAPVIVISGSADENMAANVIKLGASEFVVKTRKSLEEIPSLVEKYLKKARPATHQVKKAEGQNFISRELDGLTQKAKLFMSDSSPKNISSLKSMLDQIERLKKMTSKLQSK